MRRRRGSAKATWLNMLGLSSLVALVALLSSSAQTVQAAGEQCSATQKCPASSPCCGPGGTCGGGALFCAGGCQPMMSHSASSCLPNPVCTDKDITFAPSDYKNPHQFYPILLYNGNASLAPFTLDYGYLGQGPQGVLLELTQPSQARLSTTDYMLYGNVSLTARHTAMAGLVFAFITMSDTRDEIDWEFTTNDPHDLQTNYFSQGVVAKGTAAALSSPNVSVEDWHTYGLNWSPTRLQWTVDGKVMRTVTQAQAGDNYPRSPSRIQISVWAGGNSTNPEGVIDWSGGAIDWTQPSYVQQGYYSAEILEYKQSCAPLSSQSPSSKRDGGQATSWVYTGQQDPQLNAPGFSLSNSPITYLEHPSLDAHPGVPGYEEQSPFTKEHNNAWDGSGDTSGLPKSVTDAAQSGPDNDDFSSSSSSSNSGGWLDNNRTLSIAVPIVAAVVVVAFIWGLGVWLWRKMRRSKPSQYDGDAMQNVGVMANKTNGGLGNATPLATLKAGGVPKTGIYGGRTSDYHKLDNDDEDDQFSYDKHSYDSSSYHDAAPMGAQRVGKGLGPAVGPSPGPMRQARGTPQVSFQAPSPFPASTPQPYTVRGPYTPGMNVYSPPNPATPAMRGVFASTGGYGDRSSYNNPRSYQTSPERNAYAQSGYDQPYHQHRQQYPSSGAYQNARYG